MINYLIKGTQDIVMEIVQISTKGKYVEARELLYFFHVYKQNSYTSDTCIDSYNPINNVLTLLV
jgi:hypothetical protein